MQPSNIREADIQDLVQGPYVTTGPRDNALVRPMRFLHTANLLGSVASLGLTSTAEEQMHCHILNCPRHNNDF